MNQLKNKILNDRYQIKSTFSRQRGKRTFLADDLQTNASVVIKLLLFDPDFAWQDLKLFERESQALQSLDRPEIPKYVDYFELETPLGQGFALVQSYIPTRSLQHWIESGRTFSEMELKAIASELLQLLNYLHTRVPPVIHRDIKPSNILLGDRSGNSPGAVYLVDFGSVQTSASYGTRTIVGSYGYMPPEQFSGEAEPASDLYALGATIIYLASGQHPHQLPQQEFRILFADRVTINPHLINWLESLIEPNIDLRFKSASQALEALRDSNLQSNSSPKLTKPFGSKIQLIDTTDRLEITIHPHSLDLSSILLFGFILLLNSFLIGGYYKLIYSAFIAGDWFGVLSFSTFVAPFLCTPLCWLNWYFIDIFFVKVKLSITRSQIFLSFYILGIKLFPISFRGERKYIDKIQLNSYASLKKDDTDTFNTIPNSINIWVGVKKLTIHKYCFPEMEVEWIAQCLSDRLNIPLTRN